jgi:hypothetical protein
MIEKPVAILTLTSYQTGIEYHMELADNSWFLLEGNLGLFNLFTESQLKAERERAIKYFVDKAKAYAMSKTDEDWDKLAEESLKLLDN